MAIDNMATDTLATDTLATDTLATDTLATDTLAMTDEKVGRFCPRDFTKTVVSRADRRVPSVSR